MEERKLPNELVSLIHHVKLNESGWKKKLNEHLILATGFELGETFSVPQAKSHIFEHFQVRVSDQEMRQAIQTLDGRGNLIKAGDEVYRLSQEAKQRLQDKAEESNVLESKAKQHFTAIATSLGLDTNSGLLWKSFKDDFIYPLVNELGARTFELVTGDLTLDEVGAHTDYIDTFRNQDKDEVFELINKFFNQGNDPAKNYILQVLHAHLLAMAGGLDESTLKTLDAKINEDIQVRVFIDTNFLFSILNLHSNPANEAAKELKKLSEELSGRVNVKLYVFPTTLEEAERTLAIYQDKLSGTLITPKMSRAASRADSDLSGITKKFIERARTGENRISAEEYFEPYVSNLLDVVRNNGIELYNTNIDKVSQKQEVIDDIENQKEYEKRTRGEENTKSHEVIKHDIVLWHIVGDKRVSVSESPIDAGFWVTTLDYRLMQFDRHKINSGVTRLPRCVHPSTLIQMLELWSPQSQAIDNAVFSGIRSLLPEDFDPEAEQATVDILQALSRYENIDDLSEDSIASVMMDKALRSRVGESEDFEESMELVEETLLGKLEEAKSAAGEKESQVEELSDEVDRLRRQREELKRELRKEKKAIGEYENKLDAQDQRNEKLRDRVDNIEKRARVNRYWRRRLAFSLSFIAFFVLAIWIGIEPVGSQVATHLKLPQNLSSGVCSVLLSFGIVFTHNRFGRRIESISKWSVFGILEKLESWGRWVIGGTLIGVISNFLYNLPS